MYWELSRSASLFRLEATEEPRVAQVSKPGGDGVAFVVVAGADLRELGDHGADLGLAGRLDTGHGGFDLERGVLNLPMAEARGFRTESRIRITLLEGRSDPGT